MSETKAVQAAKPEIQKAQVSAAHAAASGSAPPPLTILPHPVGVYGKSIHQVEFLPGETLGRYMTRCGVALPLYAFKVFHNARIVPDALWDRLIPRQGDSIIIRAIAQGGGGGGGKVLRSVAMIALMVVTYGVGSFAGLGASLASATGMSVGLASAAIMIGGSILISPLMPEIEA